MYKSLLLCLCFIFSMQNINAQSDSIYLWENEIPGETGPKKAPVPRTLEDGSVRIYEITNPFMAVFEPEEYKRNGKAIVIFPGGGYRRLAVQKEGYAPAQWLRDLGYTTFVVQYRVPENQAGALQDAQRAMKMVRSMAIKYRIDPDKIGGIGFSAGAHLVALTGMAEDDQTYPDYDDAELVSSRPNAMMIIYPGYLDAGPNRSLSPNLIASESTVPTFIHQSMDDGIAQSSFALAQALRNAGSSVELHMVPSGGHGYGMYPGNKGAEAWPKLLEPWLKEFL